MSSSGLPENSGLKYDQLNCGICTGGACGCIGLGGFAGGLGGCIGFGGGGGGFGGCTGFGTCAGGLGGCSGFGGGLVVGWEDLVNKLEDLVEVLGWECVAGNLYLEGFVGYEGLDFVLDPLVLSPLMILMEDPTLEGSVLEGFALEGF